jgi:GDPmannose 4,6-dehydratase
MKRALVTGITGQDGSYLAEFLLLKGYEVYGLVRRLSAPNYERIETILDRIVLIQGDMLDQSSLSLALDKARPDEVYNLAAMSHVGTSFQQPVACAEMTGMGTLRLLEAIRLSRADVRFYQAGTSELFGNASETPQNEATPFHPRSPYGNAKLFAHQSVRNYRESYGLFAVNGILFNHESPRRGLDFVTRKITDGVARIKAGLLDKIALGNINVYRDWGYAGDYVQAMWAMLQQESPDDYVIATGKSHSVIDFVRLACQYAGLQGSLVDYITPDASLTRSSEVHSLVGDASKAKRVLGWEPEVGFHELVAMMVQSDLRRYHDETHASFTYRRVDRPGRVPVSPL